MSGAEGMEDLLSVSESTTGLIAALWWAESVTFHFPLSPEHPLLTWMPTQGRKLLGSPSLFGEGSGSSPGMQIGCSHVDPGLDLC